MSTLWFFGYFLLAQIVSCIHRDMDHLMFHHVFGKTNRENVPEYWLDTPTKALSGKGFFYEITIDGRQEKFWLEPKNQIIAPSFHIVTKEENNSSIRMRPNENDLCLYQGTSVTHNGSIIALSGCGEKMHGLVVSDWGEFYLIQPETKQQTEKHIIQKRSTERVHDSHTCLFDSTNDPYPNDIYEHHVRGLTEARQAVLKNSGMTIELAVFADDALWRHFQKLHHQNADAELHKFILAAVNNIDILFTQRSIEPRIEIRVVRYEVMKKSPIELHYKNHLSGDVDRLLDAFCDYQHSINPPSDDDPRHWDHALLFSGYDLYRNGLKTVAGYAPVKGMCSGQRSCTINEGLDFGSVFVVTHEMGHSLGMYHDGDNECDLRCCIMSPSVGSGKTRWSHCSVNEMSAFLGRLGSDFRPPNCLLDNPVEEEDMIFTDKDNPGQIFPLDEQCEIFHGECWRHELKEGQRLEDVCSIIWCGNGEGIIRTAHPALEGTYCGPGKQCRSGVCVSTYRSLPVVHGGWSEWNDSPGSACGGECVSCQIQGQIRVRRSIRQCNHPSPNNGGAQCYGDEARGLRCEKEICRGVTPDQYATNICTKLKNDPALPNPQLTGQGTQFEQSLCKVWCLLSLSNNIRTVSNFPDGTPCGYHRYCIKGECRPIWCSGSTVSNSDENCPASVRPTPFPYRPIQPPSPSIQTNSITEPTERQALYWNQWTGWSLWSQCISYNCDARGYRVRARRCLAGNCEGQSREREHCNPMCATSTALPPTTQQFFKFSTRYFTTTTTPMPLRSHLVMNTENSIAQWTPWSGCSASCGKGMRLRRRKNCKKNCVQYEQCTMGACATPYSDRWTGWSEWSVCSRSCGSGVQLRRRDCIGNRCVGPDNQGKKCDQGKCGIGWTDWSDWSPCSVTCGTGSRHRKRRCFISSCIGNDSDAATCFMKPCDSRRPRSNIGNTETEEFIKRSSGFTGLWG